MKRTTLSWLAAVLIGGSLCGLLAGCGDSPTPAPDKAQHQTAAAPDAPAGKTLPDSLTSFPALVRGPLAPSPDATPVNIEALQQRVISGSLKSARDACLLATGVHGYSPERLAPFMFCWPVDAGVPVPLTSVQEDAQDTWTISWGNAQEPARVVAGLSSRQLRASLEPKVASSAALTSSIYASGEDDFSVYRRWSAAWREGPARFEAPMARRLTLIGQVAGMLHSLLQETGTFPQSNAELAQLRIGFINMVPVADPSDADFVLEWDGVQAYGLSVRVNATERFAAVLYVESIGLDGTEEPAMSFGETGASTVSSGESRLIPRFLYDRYAGRSMTLIGAWNLVPAEQAKLPWGAVTS